MEKIKAKDILSLEDYEKVRPESRKMVWDIKKKRRLSVGSYVSILFENRETVIHQIEEMIRAEQIMDPARVHDEIETYNALIPEYGELSATLFIEIEEDEKIKEILDRLMGIDEMGIVYIQMGDSIKIHAVFEKGRSKEDKISAVHYVKFKFNESDKRTFFNTAIPANLIINHPNYKVDVEIDYELREALKEDLS